MSQGSVSSSSAIVLQRDDTYVLNHCARYLARDNIDHRHNFGQYDPDDPTGRICEAWRYPIIDAYSSGPDGDLEVDYAFNEVTFVYMQPAGRDQSVAVVGSFCDLWDPIALRRIPDTPFHAVTVKVPKGQVHTYIFLVDGAPTLDPINPQRDVLPTGRIRSRFFTNLCTIPLALTRREMETLEEVVSRLLPVRIEGADRDKVQALIREHYRELDKRRANLMYLHAYRPDPSIGVANFIDKLLAREESHNLINYRLCLPMIRGALERRHPGTALDAIPTSTYADLTDQMQRRQMPEWDFGRYRDPDYFVKLLRRHVFTGAFSHPKYGGNAGAVGWAFLEAYFTDPNTKKTLFDWRTAVERPLGTSTSYRGFLGT